MLKNLVIVLAVLAAGAAARAAEVKEKEPEIKDDPKRIVTWDDEETGAHYMLLPQARNFSRTFAACRNRGWDILTLKYLSAEEQERFFASPLFEAIPWTVKFRGEPGEIRELGIWQGSEKSDYAGGVAEMLWMKERKVDHKRQMTLEERSEGGMDDTVKHAAVCMFRGESWYRCNVETACVSEQLAYTPSPVHFYPIGNHRETIYEEGETQEAARTWILKRANWSWTSEDGMRHQECNADLATFRCEKVR